MRPFLVSLLASFTLAGTGNIDISDTFESQILGYCFTQIIASYWKQWHILSKVSPLVIVSHRLADHIESCDTFSLMRVKFLVVDEADRLLSGSFDEQLRTIFNVLPKERQNLLFSATMTEALDAVNKVATNQVGIVVQW